MGDAKSERALLDVIRGRKVEDGHVPGLLERQHSLLWPLPFADWALSFLCADVPVGVGHPSEERLLRAAVGHTWNFKKTAEFVTWTQLIEGKHDLSGITLVAPARLSRSTLSVALDSTERAGWLYRLQVRINERVMQFLAPNPLAGGRWLPGRLADADRYGGESTYATTASPLIRDLLLMPSALGAPMRVTPFLADIVAAFRQPELIAVFVEEASAALSKLLEPLRVLQASAEHEFSSGQCLQREFREECQEKEQQVYESLTGWFGGSQVQQLVQEIVDLKEGLNGGDTVPSNIKLFVRALVYRWGVPLLALSPERWSLVWAHRQFLPSDVTQMMNVTADYLAGQKWHGGLKCGVLEEM